MWPPHPRASFVWVACTGRSARCWRGYATTSTEKLERRQGTNVLVPHGYAAHWNGKRWVKSTPVFNRNLCERLGTRPLAWSAEEDRVFQPTDASGSQFMEYLEDYGLFAEVPMDFLKARLQAEYPHCFTASGQWRLPPET